MNWPELLDRRAAGNELLDYAWAAAAFVGALGGFLLARRLILERLRALAQLTSTDLDDVAVELLAKIKAPECYAVALYAATRHLTMHPRFDRGLRTVAVVLVAYRAVTLLQAAAAYGIRRAVLAEGADPGHMETAQTVTMAANVFIWTGAIVFTLSNLGFDVSSMLAGLGITGIAVALAAQAVLGDLFSAVAIYLDKPFVIGDAIKVGDMSGVVQHIGVKTTRVRALTGEVLVFPNASLTSSRIQNFRDVQARRHQLNFRVPLGTAPEKLERVPGRIKAVVERTPTVRFERAHLMGLGESGFEFEAVFHVLDADYNTYMDRVQAVLLGVAAALREDGVALAVPTRAVVVEGGRLPA